MIDKTNYLNKFKELYKAKNGIEISDSEALAGFDRLVCLVEAVTGDVPINRLIAPSHGQ